MVRIFVLDDMNARHQVIARRFPDAERVHAWNFLEAVAALTTGRFDLMLLDHDLGEEYTGLHVAERIAALRSDWLPLEAVIHSHNPVGAERMLHVLEGAGIRTRLEPFMSDGVRRPDEPSRLPASFEKRMEAFLDACRALPDDLPLESLLANLRVAGASKVETIMALRTLRGIGIGESKALVDASQTWVDRREADAELHESLLRSMEELLELERRKKD